MSPQLPPAQVESPAAEAVSRQKTSEVPQNPKREQQAFSGQFVLPSAENSPQGALASQSATHVFGEDGEQCSLR
jgi:hypothetical protein